MVRRRHIALGVAALILLSACSATTSVGPPTTLSQTPPAADDGGQGDADGDGGQSYAPGDGGRGDAPGDGGKGDAPGGGGQLVGIWIGEGVDILGNASVIETVLEPTGRFSQTTYSSADPIWIVGTYRLVDEATIRFTFEDHTRQWCGPLGCQELYFPDGETVFFEFTDANTLVTWGYQDSSRQIHRRAS